MVRALSDLAGEVWTMFQKGVEMAGLVVSLNKISLDGSMDLMRKKLRQAGIIKLTGIYHTHPCPNLSHNFRRAVTFPGLTVVCDPDVTYLSTTPRFYVSNIQKFDIHHAVHISIEWPA